MATIKVKRTTGSTPPSGLTFGELAFVQGLTAFYVTDNNQNSIWIGSEIDTDANLTSQSDYKIPTQLAVKSYVDAAVSGSGTNQFNQIGVAGQPGLTADSASDILNFSPGSGITITTTAGSDTITIGNTGVVSITGTTNEIEVSGTGTVQVGLPNDVTITNNLSVGNDLTITGNFTVNGTTTTVNSEVTIVDDPMMLLGTSGGVPLSVSDGGKDRGIAFSYFNGSGYTGFFGFDASANKFTFVPQATVEGDIVTSGSVGDAQFKSVYLTVDGTNVGGLTLDTLTSNRTYTLPDVSGTIVTTGDTGTVTSTMIANGTITNDDINASAGIVDTKLATISTANKVSLSALDIDGGTDIGAAIVDGDLIIVDDGGAGTNRQSTVQRLAQYVFTKVTGGDITIDSNGAATIAADSVLLGTDTTGNYVASVSTSSTGLSVSGSGESAAVTVNFATITTGLNMGTFSFASGEFSNSSGTVSLAVVDGGSY